MTSPKKFAHEVVIDYRDESITIDGIAFPYWVMPDPEVEIVGDGTLGALHIGLLTDNLTVIGRQGQVKTVITAPPHVDLRWARARAKEIVLEGLAPVVEWIGQGMPR